MTYILIVMWFGASSSWSGKAAISVEFNDLASCQAAAVEIRKQSDNLRTAVGTMVCAAKGRVAKP